MEKKERMLCIATMSHVEQKQLYTERPVVGYNQFRIHEKPQLSYPYDKSIYGNIDSLCLVEYLNLSSFPKQIPTGYQCLSNEECPFLAPHYLVW